MEPLKIKEILEKNKKDWEEIAKEFSQTRYNLWFEFKDFEKYLNKKDKVLDLGCGNGRFYEFLKSRAGEYVGLDQSKALISLAQQRFPGANFIIGDALNLETKFSKNEFEIIFSIAFLHHLPSKKLRIKVLRNCYNLLKPEGYLILSVWNLFQPQLIKKYKIWKVLFGFKNVFISFKAGNLKTKRYYYVFWKKELSKLVKKAGFEIKDIYYIRKGHRTSWTKAYNLILIAKKND